MHSVSKRPLPSNEVWIGGKAETTWGFETGSEAPLTLHMPNLSSP